MRTLLAFLALTIIALAQSGCVTACGPFTSVPTQRLALVAPSATEYAVRIEESRGPSGDVPFPPDGKLSFEVPITNRKSTTYFLLVPVYHHPPAENRRIIHVLRNGRTIRKLSAHDIAQLPADAAGYHVLTIK